MMIFSLLTRQRDAKDFTRETTRKERRTMCIRLARSTRIRFARTMTLIQDYSPSLIILPSLRPPSPPPLGINVAVAVVVTVFSLSLAERTQSPARDAITNYLREHTSWDRNRKYRRTIMAISRKNRRIPYGAFFSEFFFSIHLLQKRD